MSPAIVKHPAARRIQTCCVVDTRTAVRYMAGSFYSNVQQMLLMPSRVIGLASRVGRLSFRLPGRGPKHRGRAR
jgi:hypothetical protein